MRAREREREGRVDSLGDFVRARIRFPNRSNLQLANRRRRQPSNKSNSRRNGRGGGKSESTRLCTANDKKFARSQSRRCGTLSSRATHLVYVHRFPRLSDETLPSRRFVERAFHWFANIFVRTSIRFVSAFVFSRFLQNVRYGYVDSSTYDIEKYDPIRLIIFSFFSSFLSSC